MPYDVHLKSDFQRADAGVMQRGKRVAQCAAKSEEKVGGASCEARVARKRRGEVLEENWELGIGNWEWGVGNVTGAKAMADGCRDAVDARL